MDNNYNNTINSIIYYVNEGIKNGTLKIDDNKMIKNNLKSEIKDIPDSITYNQVSEQEQDIILHTKKEKNDIYNKKISEWIEEDNEKYFCETYKDRFEATDFYNKNIDKKYSKSLNIKSKSCKNNESVDIHIINSQEVNINCFKRFNIFNEQREIVTNKTELDRDKKISISFLVKGSKNILTFIGTSINKRDANLNNIKKPIIYETKKNISLLPILIPDKSIKIPIRINIGDGKITHLEFTNTKKYYINLNENGPPKMTTIYLMSSYKGGNFAIKTSFQIWSIKTDKNGESNWNIHANLLPK